MRPIGVAVPVTAATNLIKLDRFCIGGAIIAADQL
jgi:hypothetical protein